MRPRYPALLFLVSMLVAAGSVQPARADVDGDVRVGWYFDAEDAFIGGGVLLPVSHHWYANPNAEFVFVDNGDLLTVNGDFHYDFPIGQDATWWLGAGPALLFADHDGPGDDSDTDLGANLLIGVGKTRGKVRPFGQFKVILSDNTEAVLGFGIRF